MQDGLTRKNLCPVMGGKPCMELDCKWFTKLYGTDPQDKSKLIEQWDCAIPFLLSGFLEVAKRTGSGLAGVQEATERMGNDIVDIGLGNHDAVRRRMESIAIAGTPLSHAAAKRVEKLKNED